MVAARIPRGRGAWWRVASRRSLPGPEERPAFLAGEQPLWSHGERRIREPLRCGQAAAALGTSRGRGLGLQLPRLRDPAPAPGPAGRVRASGPGPGEPRTERQGDAGVALLGAGGRLGAAARLPQLLGGDGGHATAGAARRPAGARRARAFPYTALLALWPGPVRGLPAALLCRRALPAGAHLPRRGGTRGECARCARATGLSLSLSASPLAPEQPGAGEQETWPCFCSFRGKSPRADSLPEQPALDSGPWSRFLGSNLSSRCCDPPAGPSFLASVRIICLRLPHIASLTYVLDRLVRSPVCLFKMRNLIRKLCFLFCFIILLAGAWIMLIN